MHAVIADKSRKGAVGALENCRGEKKIKKIRNRMRAYGVRSLRLGFHDTGGLRTAAAAAAA